MNDSATPLHPREEREDEPNDAAIRACFSTVPGEPVAPDGRAAADLAYLIRLIRTHPRDLTHGPEHQALRAAVRTLLDVLPGMIAAAETEGAAARRYGRTTDMDHFAWRASALLEAAQPFAAVALAGQRGPAGMVAWMDLAISHGKCSQYCSSTAKTRELESQLLRQSRLLFSCWRWSPWPPRRPL